MKRSINANAVLAGDGAEGVSHWGPLVVAEGISHIADRSGPQFALL
jgi:hypothetical protein